MRAFRPVYSKTILLFGLPYVTIWSLYGGKCADVGTRQLENKDSEMGRGGVWGAMLYGDWTRKCLLFIVHVHVVKPSCQAFSADVALVISSSSYRAETPRLGWVLAFGCALLALLTTCPAVVVCLLCLRTRWLRFDKGSVFGVFIQHVRAVVPCTCRVMEPCTCRFKLVVVLPDTWPCRPCSVPWPRRRGLVEEHSGQTGD